MKECKLSEEQIKLIKDNLGGQTIQLRQKLRYVCKNIIEKLNTVKKEGRMIKEHLKSRESVIKNDEDIYHSTFVKEIIHFRNFVDE